MRTIVEWGLYWGTPVLGKCHLRKVFESYARIAWLLATDVVSVMLDFSCQGAGFTQEYTTFGIIFFSD